MILSLTERHLTIERVEQLLRHKREKTVDIRVATLTTYWHVGRFLVMNGIDESSRKLEETGRGFNAIFGRGFSRSNLVYMRKFYVGYTIEEVQKSKLTWSHYFEILKSRSELELAFYTIYAAKESWSVRELRYKMSTKFVYQVGLQQLFSINVSTRTIEKDRYELLAPATTEQKALHKIYCETQQLKKQTGNKRHLPVAKKKTLCKIFCETRPRKTRKHTAKPQHLMLNTQYTNSPPLDGVQVISLKRMSYITCHPLGPGLIEKNDLHNMSPFRGGVN